MSKSWRNNDTLNLPHRPTISKFISCRQSGVCFACIWKWLSKLFWCFADANRLSGYYAFISNNKKWLVQDLTVPLELVNIYSVLSRCSTTVQASKVVRQVATSIGDIVVFLAPPTTINLSTRTSYIWRPFMADGRTIVLRRWFGDGVALTTSLARKRYNDTDIGYEEMWGRGETVPRYIVALWCVMLTLKLHFGATRTWVHLTMLRGRAHMVEWVI